MTERSNRAIWDAKDYLKKTTHPEVRRLVNSLVWEQMDPDTLGLIATSLVKEPHSAAKLAGLHALALMEQHGAPHHELVIKHLAHSNESVASAAAQTLSKFEPYLKNDHRRDAKNALDSAYKITTSKLARHAMLSALSKYTKKHQ